MMQDRLPNGASVSRWHAGETTLTELLALFQYEGDAREFCASQIARDKARGFTSCSYILALTYSGKVEVCAPAPTLNEREG